MKRLVLLINYCFLFATLSGQNENLLWITGSQEYTRTSLDAPDTGINKLSGANILDFKVNPYTITRYDKSLGLTWNVINMCDNDGDLLFYSNGSKIFNHKHRLIENADSLNYSKYWEAGVESGYFADYIIGSYPQSMICIPHPYNENQYYLVSIFLDWGGHNPGDDGAFKKIMYSILDMSENGGDGKLIVKENVLAEGNFAQGVYACRHGNGNDWWLYVRSMNNTNEFYKMSINVDGISLDSTREKIGYTLWSKVDNSKIWNSTGGNFSHNGKYFAFMSHKGLELFEFDRCTGEFSNVQYHDYPMNDTNYHQRSEANVGQAIFSPNNEYVYYVYSNRIYQYKIDTSDFQSSQIRVATYDGFKDHLNNDTNFVGFPTTFGTIQLAPDGKMYIGNGTTARYLTVMDYPNKRGLACNVRQHAINMLTYTGGVPYYPNYNLKADTCPTNTISESNLSNLIDVEIYPNPASDYVAVVSGHFSVVSKINLYNTLGQAIKPKLQRIKNGYKLDMESIPSGIYLLKIIDTNGTILKTERLVVQRD